MITVDNVQYRNLEEQVRKNMDDIKFMLEEEGVLNEFGIKVVAQVSNTAALPNAATYGGEYGDAFAVGTVSPYTFYIFTRANGGVGNDYWFNIGVFPAPSTVPGPQGPKGDKGEPGLRGSIWTTGSGEPTHSGNTNDQYLNTSDGGVYRYIGGSWQLVGNIRGPQGIQGLRGNIGPQGPQGNIGPRGEKGDPGPAFVLEGVLADVSLLPDPATLPDDIAYLVGTEATGYALYVQLQDGNQWFNVGNMELVPGPEGPPGPEGGSIYDLVIRTQAEFEDMIADGRELTNANIQSSTWKGAKSVALVGEFVLDFKDNEGIKRPSTVTRIDGFNNAKITITKYLHKHEHGGLYNEGADSAKCCISNLTVSCTMTGTGSSDSYGFNDNNNNYTNCTGIGTAAGYLASSYGFGGSNNTYVNCTGNGDADGYDGAAYGFSGNNNNYTNCIGTSTCEAASSCSSYGFEGYNNRIISCTALAYVSGTASSAYAIPIKNWSTSANLFMIIKNCKFPQIAKAGYNQGTMWCDIADNTTMKGAIKDNLYHSRFTAAVIAGAGVEQENNQAVDITSL